MKLDSLLAVLGCGATALKTASTMAVLIGGFYLVDCRLHAPANESIDRCWFTALPIMGIGVAGRGGFNVGFNTLNPALRPEDQTPSPERDEKGRFLKKQG